MKSVGKVKSRQIFFLVSTLVGCLSSQNEPQSTLEILKKIANNRQQDLYGVIKNIPKFNERRHSDGCSGGMSAVYAKLVFLHHQFGETLPWRYCCIIHDAAYYKGGSRQQKIEADEALKTCVSDKIGQQNSGIILGQIMKDVVAIGGSPYFPTSYRWGYGIDFRGTERLPAHNGEF